MRTFIAIDIPEEIKKELIKIQKQLPEFKGKLTEKENLHLTLKFLGEIEEEKLEKLKKELSKNSFRKFEASLGNLGTFKADFLKIVWIKIENCEKIQEEADKTIEGLFTKEKRFMSHLTIARVKDVDDKNKFIKQMRKIIYEKKKFPVESIKLKKSTLTQEGPIYEDVLEIKLE
jgi:2'-5' RNA ligase